MNAKKEFISHTQGIKSKILCAIVSYSVDFGTNNYKYLLKLNYSQKDYQDFLNSLDFEYDSGYGSQELEGIIWYKNSTWSTRGEYDGSEWWEYNQYPKIPKELN